MAIKVTMSNQTTIRLFGGLGNQLFQYFAGLDLSIRSESNLIVDCRWIESNYAQDKSDIRDFQFLKSAETKTIQNFGQPNFILERIKTRIAKEFNAVGYFFKINVPNNTGYFDLKNIKKGMELRGYYQSYKYFDNVSGNSGTTEWSLETESNYFLSLKNKLNTEMFIALHVRGADYLRNANIYHQLTQKYYSDSLKAINSKLKDIKIYVFSDDIAFAKNVLKDCSELEFVDQKGLRASEAMTLMSLAKAIVIANSTFSYWAAMMNTENQVIAPKFWYTNKLVDKDLYPPRWTIV